MQTITKLAVGAAILMGVQMNPTRVAAELQPPVAKIIPHEMAEHGATRVDNYYWLKERDNPEVIEYLKAENAYTESAIAPLKGFEDELYREIIGRIKQTDLSVPYRDGAHFYYSRYEEGQEYPLYCRKKGSLEADEEVMLNVNKLAEGHEYCAVSSIKISTNENIAAYAIDTVGRRIYDIRFRDLSSGADLPDVIQAVTGGMVWANDNRTLFYARQDPETLRSYQIFRHTLGDDPQNDTLIYQEDDDTYWTYVLKSKSKKYIFIASFHTLRSEYRFLDADNPNGDFAVFLPRGGEHEYDIEHFGDRFYIRTNLNAKNFRLMSAPVNATSVDNWREEIPHRDDVLLEDVEFFKDYLVLEERKDGLNQIRIRPWDGSEEHYLKFNDPAYSASTKDNHEMDSEVLRFTYESLSTPETVYDYNMRTHQQTLLKREEVLGEFDPDNYVVERHYAPTRDGKRAPISLFYRKGMRTQGGNPTLLYGYGSYGYSIDPGFSSYKLSLVNRGFVYAMAHIRGSSTLGRAWYDDGKMLNKKNTFNDFIDCGEYLIKEGYAPKNQLYAMGGSAGGLLMGAVINMRPDLFYGVVAAVPFVDVITTMLDPSIPLTTGEYDEWGNPNKKEYYDYILSYSPYDNVTAQNYPNLLVMTGLHDSQVQYWEPTKWVAKLRATKTDSNLLLLKTNMDAGHSGASGRFKRYKEIALEYTFLLSLAGRATPAPPAIPAPPAPPGQ